MSRTLMSPLDISAAADITFRISAGRSPEVSWYWIFTLPAGTGDNTLTIAADAVLFIQEPLVTQQDFFPLPNKPAWNHPATVRAAEIAAAPNATLILPFRVPNDVDAVRLTFDVLGPGTRTFRLAIEGSG